jgi:hypothetical protein
MAKQVPKLNPDWVREARDYFKKFLKVTKFPHPQVWVLPVVPTGRHRTLWTFVKQAHLRHIGDVTVLFSRRRRNDSPKQTKLLVTNLPTATARMVVAIYLIKPGAAWSLRAEAEIRLGRRRPIDQTRHSARST